MVGCGAWPRSPPSRLPLVVSSVISPAYIYMFNDPDPRVAASPETLVKPPSSEDERRKARPNRNSHSRSYLFSTRSVLANPLPSPCPAPKLVQWLQDCQFEHSSRGPRHSPVAVPVLGAPSRRSARVHVSPMPARPCSNSPQLVRTVFRVQPVTPVTPPLPPFPGVAPLSPPSPSSPSFPPAPA